MARNVFTLFVTMCKKANMKTTFAANSAAEDVNIIEWLQQCMRWEKELEKS